MKEKCKECLCFECSEDCKCCEGCINPITKCEKSDYDWINPEEE